MEMTNYEFVKTLGDMSIEEMSLALKYYCSFCAYEGGDEECWNSSCEKGIKEWLEDPAEYVTDAMKKMSSENADNPTTVYKMQKMDRDDVIDIIDKGDGWCLWNEALDRKLNRDILETYGASNERLVCMEELGELIQAISKMERSINEGNALLANRYNLVEELADVANIIDILMEMYNISGLEMFNMIRRKNERNQRRLLNFKKECGFVDGDFGE